MKKKNYLTLLILTISFLGFGIDKRDEGKKKVLIISFIEDNFDTDIYSKEKIAKKNKIVEEEVLTMYNQKISSIFTKYAGVEISYIPCPSKTFFALKEKIFFKNKKLRKEEEGVATDLSNISVEVFNGFLEEFDADYVLFLNAYQMAWIGDPQYKLENKIHYSAFKRNKEEIQTNVYTFSTPDLMSIMQMTKKYQKAVMKISAGLTDVNS